MILTVFSIRHKTVDETTGQMIWRSVHFRSPLSYINTVSDTNHVSLNVEGNRIVYLPKEVLEADSPTEHNRAMCHVTRENMRIQKCRAIANRKRNVYEDIKIIKKGRRFHFCVTMLRAINNKTLSAKHNV